MIGQGIFVGRQTAALGLGLAVQTLAPRAADVQGDGLVIELLLLGDRQTRKHILCSIYNPAVPRCTHNVRVGINSMLKEQRPT
jgi:hypothetical protein